MSSASTDPDAPLRDRLREKIGTKSEGGDPDGEATDSESADSEEDTVESEMDAEAVNEAIQMLVEEVEDEDVTPEQVMELLDPILGDGEDTRDADTEMAGDYSDDEDDDGEMEAEALPDDVVTEEDLDAKLDGVVTEDALDEKLDEVVDALAAETKDVMQKADVGSTPEPTSTGSPGVSKDDLFSDTGGDN